MGPERCRISITVEARRPKAGTRAPCSDVVGLNRTTNDPATSSNSGSGHPSFSASARILLVPRPHFSIRPRRWKTSAMSRFRGIYSCVPLCFSGVRPAGNVPVLQISKRSSKKAALTAPPSMA